MLNLEICRVPSLVHKVRTDTRFKSLEPSWILVFQQLRASYRIQSFCLKAETDSTKNNYKVNWTDGNTNGWTGTVAYRKSKMQDLLPRGKKCVKNQTVLDTDTEGKVSLCLFPHRNFDKTNNATVPDHVFYQKEIQWFAFQSDEMQL